MILPWSAERREVKENMLARSVVETPRKDGDFEERAVAAWKKLDRSERITAMKDRAPARPEELACTNDTVKPPDTERDVSDSKVRSSQA